MLVPPNRNSKPRILLKDVRNSYSGNGLILFQTGKFMTSKIADSLFSIPLIRQLTEMGRQPNITAISAGQRHPLL